MAHEVQEILRKDGDKGWVNNRKYPIRNDAGEIVGLFGIARNIPDLKSITRELELQQQFSRSLIENLPASSTFTPIPRTNWCSGTSGMRSCSASVPRK